MTDQEKPVDESRDASSTSAAPSQSQEKVVQLGKEIEQVKGEVERLNNEIQHLKQQEEKAEKTQEELSTLTIRSQLKNELEQVIFFAGATFLGLLAFVVFVVGSIVIHLLSNIWPSIGMISIATWSLSAISLICLIVTALKSAIRFLKLF